MLTEAAVGLSQVQAWGGLVWWNEARPSEAGRQVIVAVARGGGGSADGDRPPAGSRLGPRCTSTEGVATRGYEEVLVWSNWDDQRLWVSPGPPIPIR